MLRSDKGYLVHHLGLPGMCQLILTGSQILQIDVISILNAQDITH